jgi:cytochrome P450
MLVLVTAAECLYITQYTLTLAQAFRPERFATNAIKKVDKAAYIPFGVGRRSCIGRHMAVEELQVE